MTHPLAIAMSHTRTDHVMTILVGRSPFLVGKIEIAIVLAHVDMIAMPLATSIAEAFAHHFTPFFHCPLPLLANLVADFVLDTSLLAETILLISIVAGGGGAPLVIAIVPMCRTLIVLFTVVSERKVTQCCQ